MNRQVDTWRVARRTGLVLTAGGARGAYQAGVLQRIAEIPALREAASPFPIVTGASAGAINGAAVAAYSAQFGAGMQLLAQLWANLRAEQVYRTDLRTMAGTGSRFVLDALLGSLTGAGRVHGLLDTSPLRTLLAQHLPLTRIGEAIRKGQLDAVAVTATGYHSGKAYTFIQGQAGHPVWTKSRRVALPVTQLGVEHILASAAIPLVFPPAPVSLDGTTAWFGDGALRLVTPLSPAIRLGASRVLAIGVRCQTSADDLTRAELARPGEAFRSAMPCPPLQQICGVFMNAIFLDHLDADLDHLLRMNEMVRVHGEAMPVSESGQMHEPMRVVEPLAISPSEDLALIAGRYKSRIPRTLRVALDALGQPDAQSADLASYLLFDPAYTRELLRVGHADATRRIAEIEAFLRSGPRAEDSPRLQQAGD